MTPKHSLNQLQQQLDEQLHLLGLPERNWMPQRYYQKQPLLDVVIIGAGMAGLCAAASLKLKGVHNLALYEAAAAGQEGPWATFARMNTLRSPKDLAGPALGVPALTFQAWYQTLYGSTAWQNLGRIPRLVWHDYLQWYRHALQLPVHHAHQLLRLHTEQCDATGLPIMVCHLQDKNENTHKTVYARHVVLATGMDGLGGPNLPAWVQQLPRRCWQHSSEHIKLTELRGRQLAIVGGGDSALDTAASALEQGADSVDLFVRASSFSQINYWKAYTHAGHRDGFASLDTEQKRALFGFLGQQSTPPAQGTIERIKSLERLYIHFDVQIEAAHYHDDKVWLHCGQPLIAADHLILATGYVIEPTLRPELQQIRPYLSFFPQDFFAPGLPRANNTVPRLNADFSFQSHCPEHQQSLQKIHCFTHASLLSVGKIAGDIPGISAGAQSLSKGIVAKLYQAEFDYQLEEIKRYDEQEITTEALDCISARRRIVDTMHG